MRESAAERYKALRVPIDWMLDKGCQSQVSFFVCSEIHLCTIISWIWIRFKGLIFIMKLFFLFAYDCEGKMAMSLCESDIEFVHL